jgi:outer membrane lipoprotein-sorting protein
MASDTIDQYDYKLLGEAKVDGRPAYILEYKPKFADSGYSKIENAVDTERLMVVQSKFYDKTGKLLKVGTYTQFKQVDGRWRPFQVEMKNVQSQRRTVTSIEDIKMGLKLSENLFTVSQLQKE